MKYLVKICPKCGAKNFDDARLCMKCNTNIKRIIQQPSETEGSLPKPMRDEFHGLQPMGYTPQTWQGRYYSRVGLTFAGLYFVFFFIFSLFIILFIFSILVAILGWIGKKNGDDFLGKICFGIGIVLIVLTLGLFIISLIG